MGTTIDKKNSFDRNWEIATADGVLDLADILAIQNAEIAKFKQPEQAHEHGNRLFAEGMADQYAGLREIQKSGSDCDLSHADQPLRYLATPPGCLLYTKGRAKMELAGAFGERGNPLKEISSLNTFEQNYALAMKDGSISRDEHSKLLTSELVKAAGANDIDMRIGGLMYSAERDTDVARAEAKRTIAYHLNSYKSVHPSWKLSNEFYSW